MCLCSKTVADGVLFKAAIYTISLSGMTFLFKIFLKLYRPAQKRQARISPFVPHPIKASKAAASLRKAPTTYGQLTDMNRAGPECDPVVLQLPPADAFGLRDESLLRTLPKAQFPPGVKVGGQLEGHGDAGRVQVFNVMKIKGDSVLLDGNHPLAGKALRFDVKVLEVRPASEEEIAHRQVHGAHGHHH